MLFSGPTNKKAAAATHKKNTHMLPFSLRYPSFVFNAQLDYMLIRILCVRVSVYMCICVYAAHCLVPTVNIFWLPLGSLNFTLNYFIPCNIFKKWCGRLHFLVCISPPPLSQFFHFLWLQFIYSFLHAFSLHCSIHWIWILWAEI